MSEKKKVFPLPNINDLLKPIENINDMVQNIDGALKDIEENLRTLDSNLLNISPPTPTPKPSQETFTGQPSPNQTQEEYCFECLERHFSKAYGLLEEADRFSLKTGKLTPEATIKVRKAIEELVTAEDDIGNTVFRNPELRKMADQIKDKMRDIRKKAWSKRLSLGMATLEDLREVKAEFDKLRNMTYQAALIYIVEEQLEKTKSYLKMAGVPEDKLEQAARIVNQTLAEQKPIPQAEEELKKLLGYKHVKIDLVGGPKISFQR